MMRAHARPGWSVPLEFSRGADLVFLDPDNGLQVKSTRPGSTGWAKFVALGELQRFYDAGHSLLVYQHMARTTRRDLIRARLRQLYEQFGLEHYTTFASFDWIGLLVTNMGHTLELSRVSRRIMLDWETAIFVANNVVIPVAATASEIMARPGRAIRKQIDRLTTSAGFVNRNRQEVLRNTGLPGTDHGQSVYAIRCGECRVEYGVNGSSIHQAKCPSCQGGAAGLSLAKAN